jgi:signal peptidase I
MEKTDNNAPEKKFRLRGFTLFLLVILVVAAVFGSNVKTVIVRGESMHPTLQSGQKVLTTKAYWLSGQIKKNDIIVLQEEKADQGYFIKRVWGMPGDKIPWSMAPTNWPLENGDYTVPDGHIYVIGDNLLHSDDSRKFGAFRLEKVLGKVLTWR